MRLLALIAAITITAPVAVPVGTFAIKPGDSRVRFVVKDNRGGFTGETRQVTGEVDVVRTDAGSPEAKITAKIDAQTIRTGSGLRDNQMRSEPFLNTAKFPFITFTGTAEAENPAGRQFKGSMGGRLTVKDVTRAVKLPLEITLEGAGYVAHGEVMTRFTEFNLPIPRFLFFVAEDPITVTLDILLVPKGQP